MVHVIAVVSGHQTTMDARSTRQSSRLLSSNRITPSLIKSCCVPYKGIVLLLIWTALLPSLPFYSFFGILNSTSSIMQGIINPFLVPFIVISAARALTYLLYPVAGLLGELYWSRYKVMLMGSMIVLVGSMISIPSIALFLHSLVTVPDRAYVYYGANDAYIPIIIGIIVYQFGLGLFEANAIQFGVDQLQFASNDDVSKFVNWYYWALNVLHVIPGAISLRNQSVIVHAVSGVISGFTFLLHLFFLLYLCCSHNFIREPIGRVNPITHIVKVLRYARRHTVPVLRSAFTYGEGPPSRLDLAKERYGGPYTTEEVEDVKSFGRILLVLLSLFGVLLLDEYNLVGSVISIFDIPVAATISLCLSGAPFFYLLTLVSIPMYLMVRPYLQRCLPRKHMLKRMGISLVLIIISLSLSVPINISVHKILLEVNITEPDLDVHNLTSEHPTVLLIIPAQGVGALAFLLNFLTALEFILAQAPRNMQGLLIGIWYAYQAVAIMIKVLSTFVYQFTHYNYVVTCVKLALAVVSFVLYIIVSHWYCYRERDEPSDINEQNIIEEYTEKQLQEESILDNGLYDYYSVHSVN